jgi:UDP-N-acetylglucosamine transferase subunit ALG13
MIFVATGTTGFDRLALEMDRLMPALAEEVVIQIGAGRYVPRRAQSFRLAPSLQPYYRLASLVVSHGGLGTCLEVLEAGKPLIALSNPDRYDKHQDDLLCALEAQNYILWCRDPAQLNQAITTVRQTAFQPYQRAECRVHIHILKYLHREPRTTSTDLEPDSGR